MRHSSQFWSLATAVIMGVGSAVADSGIFVVTTADFETASSAFLPAGSSEPQLDLLSPIHGDAVARSHDGKIYIIERLFGDNIIVLDPADLTTPLAQYSVGNGANPQDIEFAGPDKAYVSRYGSESVLVINPVDGTMLGEINLSGFADGDGLPEMGQMAVVGSRLYVAVQRLENFTPVGASFVVVIDMDDDSIVDVDLASDGVQGIELSATNPNELLALDGRLFVSCVAGFGDREGGIDVIDLDSNRSQGVVVSEADLDGDITGLAMVSSERGYAIVLGSDFVTYSLLPVSISTGTVDAALTGTSNGFIPVALADGDRLVVADFGTAEQPGGLLIYEAQTGDLLQGPISMGLPPVGVALLSDPATAVVREPSTVLPDRTELGAAFPNPFNANVSIPFLLDRTSTIELAVYDSLGRRVRTLTEGAFEGGAYRYQWDGTADNGRTVSSGNYVVRLRFASPSGSRTLTSKLMFVK